MDFADLAPGPGPQLGPEAFARRRTRAAQAMAEDEVLVVATHPVVPYSNDVEPRFRPHSDFWYLTGFDEPRAVLVLEASGASTLFLQDRKPEAEIWTGRRLGVERACDVLGVDGAHPIDELGARLPDLVSRGKTHAVVAHDPEVAQRLEDGVIDGRPLMASLRLRKDADELRLLRRAAEVGVEAMEEAAGIIAPGRAEYEVEAALLAAYRRRGSTGPGYPPIVGTGANAAVLHYVANKGTIQADDAVLVDAGCEWGYYNSDITRTYPASGRFTSTQRRLYDIVLDAHAAAVKEVRPGKPVDAPHKAACRVIQEGLIDAGYLAADAAPDAFRDSFMHGTSHFLGLDVHDIGGYKDADGAPIVLDEGMVLTIEPGLYFNPDFAACPPGLAGIGIRIEDDVAVGSDGPEVLTAALPTAADAVAAMVGGNR